MNEYIIEDTRDQIVLIYLFLAFEYKRNKCRNINTFTCKNIMFVIKFISFKKNSKIFVNLFGNIFNRKANIARNLYRQCTNFVCLTINIII